MAVVLSRKSGGSGGGGAPSGPAGGDLSGSYPNPDIGAGTIDQTMLASPLVAPAVLFDSTLGAPAANIDTGAAGIAGGYRILDILILIRTTNAAVQSSATVILNNDTGANYDRDRHAIQNTTAANSAAAGANNWAFFTHGDAGVTNYASLIRLVIPFYTSTTFNKIGIGHDTILDDSQAEQQVSQYSLGWRNTAAITRAQVAASPGNLMTGSRMLIMGY